MNISNIKHNPEKFINLFPESWMNASREEQEISLKIYQFLSKKIHPNQEMLAAELPYSVDRIKAVLDKIKSLVYMAEGNIIGFAGLTTHPMPHSIQIDGITTYTWCALDALFIPELLGKQTLVRSSDPVTKKSIEYVVDVNQVQATQPNDLVVSMVDTNAEKLNEDVISNFCHFVFFFESGETGKEWTANHPDTYLVPISDALELAHLMNQTRFNHFFKS